MFRLDTSHPEGADGWAFPPCSPELLLTCDAATLQCELRSARGVVRKWGDPLEALAWMPGRLKECATESARWVGFLGYDLGGLFEKLPKCAADDTALPLFAFGLCGTGEGNPPAYGSPRFILNDTSESAERGNFSRKAFESAVSRAIGYIAEGDVFQVNLSQRLTRPMRIPPAAVYARLKDRTPAWYGALLEFPEGTWGSPFAVASNSPELFLRVEPGGSVVTRPIKGTRPRLPGMGEELRRSAKDQAELAMIVDLQRNDLGRVCGIGTVRVTEPRTIEAHPTVYHGVATIEGKLRPGVGWVELLRAAFPCGSVTGAPKIRAMQIIDELEPHRRGVYCGAIGYLSRSGRMQFNVAIRTMTFRDGLAHVPVGGGIVADSTPAEEYQETLVKARAMLEALGEPRGK